MIYRDAEHMFQDAEFVVECTGAEHQLLWQVNHEEYNYDKGGRAGFGVFVGEVDNFPVWISISMSVINGRKILEWEATSQIVDYTMCEDYVKKAVSAEVTVFTDANNFGHILGRIK